MYKCMHSIQPIRSYDRLEPEWKRCAAAGPIPRMLSAASASHPCGDLVQEPVLEAMTSTFLFDYWPYCICREHGLKGLNARVGGQTDIMTLWECAERWLADLATIDELFMVIAPSLFTNGLATSLMNWSWLLWCELYSKFDNLRA